MGLWIDALVAGGAVMLLLTAWVGVQMMARHVSRQHPESGPFREAGGGCGGGCGSCGSACDEPKVPRRNP